MKIRTAIAVALASMAISTASGQQFGPLPGSGADMPYPSSVVKDSGKEAKAVQPAQPGPISAPPKLTIVPKTVAAPERKPCKKQVSGTTINPACTDGCSECESKYVTRDEFEKRNKAVDVRLGNVEGRVDGLVVDIAAVNKRVDAVVIDIGAANKRIDVVTENIGETNKRADALTVRMGIAETGIKQLNVNLEDACRRTDGRLVQLQQTITSSVNVSLAPAPPPIQSIASCAPTRTRSTAPSCHVPRHQVIVPPRIEYVQVPVEVPVPGPTRYIPVPQPEQPYCPPQQPCERPRFSGGGNFIRELCNIARPFIRPPQQQCYQPQPPRCPPGRRPPPNYRPPSPPRGGGGTNVFVRNGSSAESNPYIRMGGSSGGPSRGPARGPSRGPS